MSLADDDRTLDQLVQMAAESSEYPNADEAYATQEVRDLASEFDDAVYAALEKLVELYPPKGGATAEDLYDADGSYLILLTLEEAGAGIWDGSWSEYYDDTDPVVKFLKSRLGSWSDFTGAGKLEEAFENAAYETAGGDEEDEDDEEYEENSPRGAYDQEAARELELYIDNDQRYAPGSPRGTGRSIVLNLLRKMKKGRYDSGMAVKAWKNLADEAAKGYAKEFDNPRRWAEIFSVPTRNAVAVGLRDQFEEDAAAGEYDHLDLRTGR